MNMSKSDLRIAMELIMQLVNWFRPCEIDRLTKKIKRLSNEKRQIHKQLLKAHRNNDTDTINAIINKLYSK